MDGDHDITLFFPVYNEEGNIRSVITTASNVLKKISRNYEVLLVLYAGSTDKSEEIIREMAKEDPHIRLVIQPTSDPGVGRAYRIGFEQAKYPIIAYSDSDNQFNLNELVKFLPYLDEYDIIAGYKLKRQDPLPRIITSWGYNTLVRTLFRINTMDVNTAFRVVKKPVLDKVKLTSRLGTVTTELLVKAKKNGFSIKQIGVTHFPRTEGKPLYEVTSGMLSPKTIINVSKEIVRLWWSVNVRKQY
mgnify:CR=1 FL=1|jgi:dolichol-phosphate mannosyltransferase|tara:strand:+ start:2385 stop:3119 length:735 start_codon:yes stop_codon:yes gene_type:complete